MDENRPPDALNALAIATQGQLAQSTAASKAPLVGILKKCQTNGQPTVKHGAAEHMQHLMQLKRPGMLQAVPEEAASIGLQPTGGISSSFRRMPGSNLAELRGGSLAGDLAKLRSEFDSLQQQLHQLPATAAQRRESLIGQGAAAAARSLLEPSAQPGPAAAAVPASTLMAAVRPAPPSLPPAAAADGAMMYSTPAVQQQQQAKLPPQAAAAGSEQHTECANQAVQSGLQFASHNTVQIPHVSEMRAQSLQVPEAAASVSEPSSEAPAAAAATTVVAATGDCQPMNALGFPFIRPSSASAGAETNPSSLQADRCPLLGASMNGACSNSLLTGSDALFSFTSTASTNSQTWKAVTDMLLNSELQGLCDEGLNKQLTRTKDGATDASRIQELAGLVKLLRKALRELGGRVSSFVDHCVRAEKEQAKQVEAVQLASESTARTLEAELAAAKKAQAGWEATSKADKAAWGAELESARYEGLRLRRELERVTEERNIAREDVARAEQQRLHAEQELKELRKASSQQIREVSTSQNEAMRMLADEKAAVERREASIKEESCRLTQRLQAANTCIEAMQSELALLQQVHESVKDALRAKAASYDTLKEQHTQLQDQWERAEKQIQQLQGEVSMQAEQLATADCAAQQAASQISMLRAQQQASQQQVQDLQQELDELQGQLQECNGKLEATVAAATSREASLLDEKAALKGALAAELSHRETLSSKLSSVQRECTHAANEITNLHHQVEFVTGLQQDAEAKAEAAQQEAAQTQEALNALEQQLLVKEERLALLEGEFAALTEVVGEKAGGGGKDVVVGLLARISSLQAAAASAEATRRKLHNELVNLRGNIRVYCRVRPHPAPVTKLSADQCSLSIDMDGKEHAFSYDRVYGPTSSQADVFSGVSELIQSALDGYHVCLFSYGQTGAGKTYTMQGGSDPTSCGIIPRAVEKILHTAASLQAQAEWEYRMEASFIEVYNNALRDLLAGANAPYINDQSAIKHDPDGGHTTVAGITKVAITDAAGAEALVRRAAGSRACEATAMNSESSRSHCCFMLYIRGSHPPSGTQLQGCLCLVDLAGSERLDRSLAEDARKKEACAINQSLSALGDVFAALASKSSHVPYRNSKLTYLLQPCLGGQGKTLMFVNINPEPASANESLCSLKFAAKVNGCELGHRPGARRATGPSDTLSVGGGTLGASGPRSALDDAKRLSLQGASNDGGKRLSLQGPARLAAAATTDAGAKRMSMYGGSVVGASRGTAAGSKRPPAHGGASQPSKRARPG